MSLRRLPSVAAALCGVVFAATGAVRADTISIRADDWFPVNGKPGSQQEGVYIDLLRAILEPAGHSVDYRLLAWEEAVESVRAGREDCVVGAARGDAPDLLFVARPWMTFDNVFYASADATFRIDTLDDLAGHTLGVIEDYSYGDTLDAYIKAHAGDAARIQTIEIGRTPLASQINRLVTGKIDVLVESSVVMQAQLQKQRLTQRVVAVGAMHEDQHIYVACSPAKPELKAIVATINQGFDQLEAQGKLDAFYAKYGLKSSELLQSEAAGAQ